MKPKNEEREKERRVTDCTICAENCIELGEKYVREAAGSGADVALLPEMFSVGYGAQFPGYTPGNLSLLKVFPVA